MRTTSLTSAVPGAGFAAFVYPALDGGEQAARSARDDDRVRLEEQWRARGHAAGYAEGLRAAAVEIADREARLDAEHAALTRTVTEEVQGALAVLRSASDALNARTVPVLQDAEDTLLSAAIDLAEAVIGHALVDEGAAARFALGRAGEAADGSSAEPHTVRLHPDDLALVDRGLNPGGRAGRGSIPATVRLVADGNLARGDAVSEFSDGYLDARIGSALQRARSALGQVAS
jgi:flagellar assembly protein FliH